jgi:hypothetical protein
MVIAICLVVTYALVLNCSLKALHLYMLLSLVLHKAPTCLSLKQLVVSFRAIFNSFEFHWLEI